MYLTTRIIFSGISALGHLSTWTWLLRLMYTIYRIGRWRYTVLENILVLGGSTRRTQLLSRGNWLQFAAKLRIARLPVIICNISLNALPIRRVIVVPTRFAGYPPTPSTNRRTRMDSATAVLRCADITSRRARKTHVHACTSRPVFIYYS